MICSAFPAMRLSLANLEGVTADVLVRVKVDFYRRGTRGPGIRQPESTLKHFSFISLSTRETSSIATSHLLSNVELRRSLENVVERYEWLSWTTTNNQSIINFLSHNKHRARGEISTDAGKIRELNLDSELKLNIPQILVSGSQSSGKSSVLEALTKIPFPSCMIYSSQPII